MATLREGWTCSFGRISRRPHAQRRYRPSFGIGSLATGICRRCRRWRIGTSPAADQVRHSSGRNCPLRASSGLRAVIGDAEPANPRGSRTNANNRLPEGSYFLPPPIPVMELASDHRSALARALLRREDFLSRTAEPPCGADMRMISNEIAGEFHDLRGLPKDLTQADRRKIGLELYEQNSAGVVLSLPEVPGGVFLNIFSSPFLRPKAFRAATIASGGMASRFAASTTSTLRRISNATICSPRPRPPHKRSVDETPRAPH